MAAPLLFEAVIGKTEEPSFDSARDQLAEALGGDRPVHFHVSDNISAIDFSRAPAAIVLSLIGDVARDEPLAQTQARWRAVLSELAMKGKTPIFVCTVFRRVPSEDGSYGGAAGPILERIRHLNLMAAHLSHDIGTNVIDIDRIFSFIGARPLGTDYRLASNAAAVAAGNIVAAALLDVGLDGAVPADVLDRAREHNRKSDKIEKALGRRAG